MENENQIIQSILNGDTANFTQIIDVNKNAVFSILLRMTGSKENAEDIAQEVFIKVFKQLKSFKGKAKLSTWIYKIAYFEGLNFLRKEKRLTNSFDRHVFVDENYSVLEEVNKEDRQMLIEKALSYLKPIERAVITLFYLEELSVKEVCEITNQSKSNVKVLVHRARKKMYGVFTKIAHAEIKELIEVK